MTSPFQTPKLPEVKFNKNGYEIRADILKLAADHLALDYKAKFAQFDVSAQRDPKTGTYVTTVELPTFPGMEQVLAAAEQMYGFVTKGITATK